MKPPAAILAGGLATRLYPATLEVPKSLLRVAGKPFIAHQLELLKGQGITRAVICAGRLGEQIQEYLAEGGRFGMALRCSFDGPQLLGTGGALQKALPLLGDIFWVLYGDSYLETDYGAIMDYFNSGSKAGLMTLFKNENRWDRSNVRFEDGRILEYRKGAPCGTMRHIDYGLSIFRKEAVAGFAPPGVKWDLSELFQRLIEQNNVLGFEVKERFYEIGSPQGLAETEAYLAQRHEELEERNGS